MRTAELTGPLLAEWVARANGYTITKSGEANRPTLIVGDEDGCLVGYIGGDYTPQYVPHQNWSQGGEIIEREGIELQCRSRGSRHRIGEWIAYGQFLPLWTGPTALIAAMRAYVGSKFGKTVPDEAP